MVLTTSSLWESNNTEAPLNITLSAEPLPTLKNWYYGDTHYHSSYTFNEVELGGPLPATMNAMNAIGLDWITVTDHSFTLKTDEKWNAFKAECNNYTNCLIGEEISCDNDGPLDYNHYLGYNLTDRIYSGEFLDNGTSPLQCSDAVNRVNSQGGFGYAAHPFYREGYYKDGLGLAYRNIWQDYNLSFTGLEIWNGEEAIPELEQGLVKWRDLLLSGRKVFIEAGSDAHGDFNSALGKVRTACFARNFTKDNIFTALKSGNCMMTDGPLVIFTANKHIIGESFNVSEGDTIQLNISWNSTNEFGNVTEIFFIRGEINGTEINETIFSPNNLSGTFTITSTPNNTYYRVEAKSIDPEGKTRRAYTNPIWVYAEPKPALLKIEMDNEEHALVSAFENKYDYPLQAIYFDYTQLMACDTGTLRKNLNLSDSWQPVKCEKQYLNNTRLMWAAFNNTDTGEKKIMLQVGEILLFENATHNEFIQNWTAVSWPSRFYGTYTNDNWIAGDNNSEVFEINEVHNSNAVGDSYFGTYLIHGFRQHDENTGVYYSHWGPEVISARNVRNVYLQFDGMDPSPFIYEGFVTRGDFNRGIFQKKSFNRIAPDFRIGADGEYLYYTEYTSSTAYASIFDASKRKIFPVKQSDSVVACHADIDCNDRNLLTKDVCANAGTTSSKCGHIPQAPEEIKKPFTEMDADEVSKAIEFRERHNRTLGEIYFDGWKNTSCNNAGILETLKLDKNWSTIQCRKFFINGTRAMFAGLNNSITGNKYAAYQLGNVLIDDAAAYKTSSEEFQLILVQTILRRFSYFISTWTGIHNGAERFEIDDFEIMRCTYSGCNDPAYYATYFIHGFDVDQNKDERIAYTFKKNLTMNWENSPFIQILFDNYRNFSLENEASASKTDEGLYATRSFGYRALNGWSIGAKTFNYPISNRTLFRMYRANEMLVELGSPAHILVNDSEGRITGYFNGTYIAEIPGSEIIDTAHEKYLLPAGANYTISVQGYETGNYSLKITFSSNEGDGIMYFQNISSSNESQDTFLVNNISSVEITTLGPEKAVYANIETASDTVSANFTIAQNKSQEVRVSAWDSMANESVLIIETISYPPEIISVAPKNNSVFEYGEIVLISANATDANNDSLEYAILFDGKEISRKKEINYALNESGTHIVRFNVSDGSHTASADTHILVNARKEIPADKETPRNSGGGGGGSEINQARMNASEKKISLSAHEAQKMIELKKTENSGAQMNGSAWEKIDQTPEKSVGKPTMPTGLLVDSVSRIAATIQALIFKILELLSFR